MLKLEEVLLTQYQPVETIPAGFKMVVEKSKGRRDPQPFPWNWYARYDSLQHELFAKLAASETGMTKDEMNALGGGEPDKVAKIEEVFKLFSGGQPRHTGWDLVADEATGTRFRLVYRDPRVHYCKEQEITLEEGKVIEIAKEPLYVSKVKAAIEELRNPKPKPEPKPRAPRKADASKGEVGSTGKTEVKPSQDPPPGGYLKAVEAAGLAGDLNTAITNLVEADTVEAVKTLLDQQGLEGSAVIDGIAALQREGKIKSGFYRLVKEVAAKMKAAPAAPAAAPAPAQ